MGQAVQHLTHSWLHVGICRNSSHARVWQNTCYTEEILNDLSESYNIMHGSQQYIITVKYVLILDSSLTKQNEFGHYMWMCSADVTVYTVWSGLIQKLSHSWTWQISLRIQKFDILKLSLLIFLTIFIFKLYFQ